MQYILIIGAGRSSTSLIDYLLTHSEKENWQITIAEKDVQLAQSKIEGQPNAKAIPFDVFDESGLSESVQENDLIISMLPASLHIHVAKKCAELGKHLLTASYLTEEIKALSSEFEKNGKLLIMEMGLDPGIDHMSAMRILDQLKDEGHELTGFETFTGGLVAEESVGDNPWQYKFTWNPRNVVLAG